MPRKPAIPIYRCHKATHQGVVTLTDSRTKQRRDVYLGEHDTAQSRERYERVVADWLSHGRRLDLAREAVAKPIAGPTVNQVCAGFLRWAKSYYSSSEYGLCEDAIGPCCDLFGTTPALDFGPNRLRLVRDKFVTKGWTRGVCNRQARRLVRVWKWAVSHELIPADNLNALQVIEPLKRGRTKAPEGKGVKPVDPAHIRVIRRQLSRQVRVMLDVQRLTGCRPAEICRMTPGAIDRSGEVWIYTPTEHKTSYRGHERVIRIGPRAQRLLRPFLLRPDDTPMFSPAEAEKARRQALHAARVTPLHHGNAPGTSVKAEPQWKPRDAYDTGTYRRAIHRACDKVGIPRWSPNRLRHLAGTLARRRGGLEAAQHLLGHKHADITQIYAESDSKAARRYALKFG